jgi:hypothetical protein
MRGKANGRYVVVRILVMLPCGNTCSMVQTGVVQMTETICYVSAFSLLLVIIGCIIYDVRERCANMSEMRELYKCDCENCECREHDHV